MRECVCVLCMCVCVCVMYRRIVSQRIVRLTTTLTELQSEMRKHSSAVSYFESLAGRQARSDTDEDTCIICFEQMTRLAVTPCGHLFCLQCITSCVNTNAQCPTCRQAVKLEQLVEIMVLCSVVLLSLVDNPG